MVPLVHIEHKDHVSIITLNRPHVLNALSHDTVLRLNEVLDEVSGIDDIRAVIFSGGESKAFCVGADLKERMRMNERETLAFVKLIQSTFERIATLKCPTIAAMNGHAFGGGLELALACDLRVAHKDAHMGLTECSLGVIPGAGGTQRLPLVIGYARALDMIITAKKISATKAHEIGLLEYITDGPVLDEAQNIAKLIKKNAPLAVKMSKEAIWFGAKKDMGEKLHHERACYEKILYTKDRLEGLTAFKEKRNPTYKGE